MAILPSSLPAPTSKATNWAKTSAVPIATPASGSAATDAGRRSATRLPLPSELGATVRLAGPIGSGNESSQTACFFEHRRPVRRRDLILFSCQQRCRNSQSLDLPLHFHQLLFFCTQQFHHISHNFILRSLHQRIVRRTFYLKQIPGSTQLRTEHEGAYCAPRHFSAPSDKDVLSES